MLNPEARGVLDEQARMSETAMQALLLNAQNRLIQLAQESNVTVAQLIEAQTDGGQRIAEEIVASALQGELKAQNKTAEELRIGSVLALLQISLAPDMTCIVGILRGGKAEGICPVEL